ERYAEAVVRAGDLVDELLAGSITRVTAWPDGQLAPSAPPPGVVLAGSFNPLHDGHMLLARVAGDIQQQAGGFEISVINVDKPPLAAREVRNRLAQFAWRARVELTRAPTFLEKSRLFPGATFVIGADTAERLVAPRYYGGGDERMAAALQEIADRGCSFLLALPLHP